MSSNLSQSNLYLYNIEFTTCPDKPPQLFDYYLILASTLSSSQVTSFLQPLLSWPLRFHLHRTKVNAKANVFFDLCRSMWTLNWILCEPILKRYRFRSSMNESLSCVETKRKRTRKRSFLCLLFILWSFSLVLFFAFAPACGSCTAEVELEFPTWAWVQATAECRSGGGRPSSVLFISTVFIFTFYLYLREYGVTMGSSFQ